MSDDDRYYLCTSDRTNLTPNLVGHVLDLNNSSDRHWILHDDIDCRIATEDEYHKHKLMEALK